MLYGGLVTDKDDVENKEGWATKTFFTFDNDEIQYQLRSSNPKSFKTSGDVSWVIRELNQSEKRKLIKSDKITIWIGADGMMAYTASVDISKNKDKVESYINNCQKSK